MDKKLQQISLGQGIIAVLKVSFLLMKYRKYTREGLISWLWKKQMYQALDVKLG